MTSRSHNTSSDNMHVQGMGCLWWEFALVIIVSPLHVTSHLSFLCPCLVISLLDNGGDFFKWKWKLQKHRICGNFNRKICQTRSRDLLICLTSLAILATIALPSLLLNHPEESSGESTTAKRKTRSAADARVEKVSYQDLLVKEPIHPVEGANPDFWLENSRQWLANQVAALILSIF